MVDIPPIHLLNLDHSTERLRSFRERNAHLGAVIRVSALDGRTLDREQLISAGYIREDLEYPAGTLGCAMSHVRLWEHAVFRGEGLTILEDDAVTAHRFREGAAQVLSLLPDDWDIVVWGYHLNPLFVWVDFGMTKVRLEGYGPATYVGWREFQATEGPFAPIRLRHCFGTHGYSISGKGARTILASLLPLHGGFVTFGEAGVTMKNDGIDVALCALYPTLKAYICVPQLVIHSEALPSNREALDFGV
jgi:GR25 family glycosyltransferase involved in LPS biosynthesis